MKAENTHEWDQCPSILKKKKKPRELPHPFCLVSILLSTNQETSFHQTPNLLER